MISTLEYSNIQIQRSTAWTQRIEELQHSSAIGVEYTTRVAWHYMVQVQHPTRTGWGYMVQVWAGNTDTDTQNTMEKTTAVTEQNRGETAPSLLL